MTLNTILQTCGKCEAKYRELYAQEPRLSDDEIMDGINKFNQEHNCPFDADMEYDIYLKSGHTIRNIEFDICTHYQTLNNTELYFTRFNKTANERYNFVCNADDIIAIGELCKTK